MNRETLIRMLLKEVEKVPSPKLYNSSPYILTMALDLDEKWLEASSFLAEDKLNFSKWENLIDVSEQLGGGITKKSSDSDKQLLDSCYENFLSTFPLCEQYWINHAVWNFHLGLTEKAKSIFQRAISIMPRSVLIWTRFISFLTETEADTNLLLSHFEKARLAIGLHFLSHEFYDIYLDYLKHNQYWREHVQLLRRIIEIPLYHYGKFFRQWLGLIDNADAETIEMIGGSPQDDDVKVKLRKTFIDVYITTQHYTFTLWQYEGKITQPFFLPEKLSLSEFETWANYIDYIEGTKFSGSHGKNPVHNKTYQQVAELVYERCLTVTALYPDFWIRYANYFCSLNQLKKAKAVLIKGIFFNPITSVKLRMRLIDIEVLSGNLEEAARLAQESVNLLPHSIEAFLKLAEISSLNGEESVMEMFEKRIADQECHFLFEEILNFNIPVDELSAFFEKHRHSQTSLAFWKACLEFFHLYKVESHDDLIEMALERCHEKEDIKRCVRMYRDNEEWF